MVIGPAENSEPLKDLAERLEIAERVWFAGFQPDEVWQPMIAATDLCCVPDPQNPLNVKSTMVKMMDYMALGKPVVAYDLVENRVTGGGAVVYARPSDPRQLAAAMWTLAEDAPLRQRLGSIGRQRIREGLSWDHTSKELLRLYGEISRTNSRQADV